VLRVFTTLLLLQTFDPMAELARARADAAAGDGEAAFVRLEELSRVYPGWGLAQIELAHVLLASGAASPPSLGASPETVRRSLLLEQALAIARRQEPENPRTWSLSGRWHEERREVAEAVAAYRKALALRPEMLDCHERLGMLMVSESRHFEALPHLWALLAARPEERGVRANLADAYEQLGDKDAAEAHLRVIVEQAPENTLFRQRLARFLERQGRSEEAEAVLGQGKRKKMRPLKPSRH